MDQKLNDLLERINDFLAARPATVLLVGIGLILLNLLLQIFPGRGWFVEAQVMLHVGIIVGLIGVLVINVYRS